MKQRSEAIRDLMLISLLVISGLLIISCASKQTERGSTTDQALTKLLPQTIAKLPTTCIKHKVLVSHDGKWASLRLVMKASTTTCLRYYVNGYWLYKRTTKKNAQWRIVFNGSSAPPCDLKSPKSIWPTGISTCER